MGAIITPAERDRVLARMAEQTISGRRTPRRYVLSGLLRCGRCGGKLFASPRENSRRYVCLSGPDHGGCGRLTVVAEPLEHLLTEAVLQRLDGPELSQLLTGDTQAAELSEGLAADSEQLDQLAVMFGKREISAREWRAAREPMNGACAIGNGSCASPPRLRPCLACPGRQESCASSGLC
ncbi:zinc ribbon domain-containing protein [Geodermatophilus sp. DSM 44513]|uniref:zinc ribbon domain-containing protein n=1 Tax=Geodermatophilus sp. DSM 44513 TaxID=1528104 RepID=UPI001277E8E6|nr:zinc ribbon domain-containing protein [Geodermatophilus sp. DSM 44513]WNV75919.1 zinc ribbon domain-containing protein [Geodermatophilus sp. DSM 44513]